MRRPKSEERALWHRATRDVTPLHRHPIHTELPRTPAGVAESEQPPAAPSSAAEEGPARRLHRPRELGSALDRRAAQRLKRGETAIEARLDLHGMTQDEAHQALERFIARAAAAGQRSLLVITGKSGVLHGAVPRWLEESAQPHRILGFARAHAQHGGAGALYLMLRRQR